MYTDRPFVVVMLFVGDGWWRAIGEIRKDRHTPGAGLDKPMVSGPPESAPGREGTVKRCIPLLHGVSAACFIKLKTPSR